MTERSLPAWLRAWPFWTLAILLVLFLLMLVFSRKAPSITVIEPSMAVPGDTIVVEGRYFGRSAQEGTLSLSGEIPPPSLIKSWTDKRIEFVVPEDAESGLLTISNSQGTSPGVLFTNTVLIPTVMKLVAPPRVPLLMDASPDQPIAGQWVTLRGRGFGTGDEDVHLLFRQKKSGPEIDFQPSDAAAWTDRQVRFRWPAGAGSKTQLTIVTPRGHSASFPLGTDGPVQGGAVSTIRVLISATFSSAVTPKTILWGSLPQGEAETTWSLVSSSLVPLTSRGNLTFLIPPAASPGKTVQWTLSLTTWAKVWGGFPSGPVPAQIPPESGDSRSAVLWSSTQATINQWAAAWRLDTSDPWLRVNRLANGLLSMFQPDLSQPQHARLSGDPAERLKGKSLSSYEMATLASAVAAASSLPARVVSGFVVGPTKDAAVRFWVVFWIAGAGWVSWDPAAGTPGTLDQHHFAFETLPVAAQRLLPASQTFGPERLFGLGEPSGEIQSGEPKPTVSWTVKVVPQ